MKSTLCSKCGQERTRLKDGHLRCWPCEYRKKKGDRLDNFPFLCWEAADGDGVLALLLAIDYREAA